MAGKKGLTDRQRRFAQLVVSGKTTTDAYVATFPGFRKRRKYATNNGWRLTKKPHVMAYMEELRAEVWKEMKTEVMASREEVLEFA